MGRKRQAESIYSPQDTNYDNLFEAVLSEAKKNYPGSVYSGGEEESLLICLPLPALSLRYLLQQEGWPLSRFVMIVGEQESGKSAFLYEIIRWHRLCKGFGAVVDTEFKPAPDLLWSILNYDYRACAYEKFKTLDGWTNGLNSLIQLFKDKMDGDSQTKGFGRVVPVCFGIDSLTATLDEKEYNKLVADGTPSKHFAVTALLLNDFIKVVTKELDEYPFTLIGINHLKPSTTMQGIPVRNIAGGKGLRFHQAMEIEMKRKTSINPGSKNQISRNESVGTVEGLEVQLSIMKNSNAPHEQISVELLWYIDFSTKVEKLYIDPNSGEQKRVFEYPQRTFFDWHSSSVEIILQILKSRTKQAKLLADVLVIEGGDDRRYCWSPTLGVPKDSKISWREMGNLLENELQRNDSFRDSLYPVLGIRRRFMYQPGVDYRQQMELAKSMTFKIRQDTLSEMQENVNSRDVDVGEELFPKD